MLAHSIGMYICAGAVFKPQDGFDYTSCSLFPVLFCIFSGVYFTLITRIK